MSIVTEFNHFLNFRIDFIFKEFIKFDHFMKFFFLLF